MLGKNSDAFMDRYWPVLLIICCAMILAYVQLGYRIAGAAGFMGLGWLAWDRLIKPRLHNDE